VHIGYYISGAGHAGLIGWLLLGSVFMSEPEPFEVTEVAVISNEQFAALSAPPAGAAPETAPDVIAPAPPVVAEPDLSVPAPEVPPELAPTPVPTPEIAADAAPVVTQVAPPPQAEVTDTAPEITPPAPDQVVLLPEVSPRPTPRPAPRVAPEAVAPPPEDLPLAEQDSPPVSESAEAETPAPTEEAAARPEAATNIVSESADVPSGALDTSPRPRSRPAQLAVAPAAVAPAPENPAPETPAAETPAPATQTAAPTPDTSAAVDAALAEALGGAASNAPVGPPLSQGERDALRVAVQDCWVVDVGSQAANVTVTLAMSMARDGTVETNSLRLLSASGGDAQAAEVAFQAARRAILRCQKDGYDLPDEKYAQWREIEMTFNPEQMRLR